MILCTLGVTVSAEEQAETIPENLESNQEIASETTVLSETINKYFIWTIPSACTIDNETTDLTVTVNEAHLASNERLEICVIGIDESGKMQLANGDRKSSKLTIKKGDTALSKFTSDIILTVLSSDYNSGSSESQSATITIERQRNKFQFAGSYNANLKFSATIKTNNS